jgi:hypothetical protein
LGAQGVEIVQADLDDVESLIAAFIGAPIIFSVTNYWEPFFRPDYRQKAAEAGISCRKYAYDVEVRQGKNIADAAARTVDSLDENGFIASALSHARKCSKRVFTELYYFDGKADVFPTMSRRSIRSWRLRCRVFRRASLCLATSLLQVHTLPRLVFLKYHFKP